MPSPTYYNFFCLIFLMSLVEWQNKRIIYTFFYLNMFLFPKMCGFFSRIVSHQYLNPSRSIISILSRTQKAFFRGKRKLMENYLWSKSNIRYFFRGAKIKILNIDYISNIGNLLVIRGITAIDSTEAERSASGIRRLKSRIVQQW